MNKRLVVALALSAILVGLSPQLIGSRSAASPQPKQRDKARRLATTNRVIIKFHDDAAASDAEAFIGMHSLSRRLNASRLQVIDIPLELDARAYAELLRQMPGVEFTEPDYLLFPAGGPPNDPLYSAEWHLAAINAPAAWEITTGSDQIILAVCDTGVDATHPDLAGQLVQGWNVVDQNGDTSPVHPHGTMVAGAAAAAGNNGIGVAAPAMNCRIMPLRITSRSDGAAATSDIIAATVWAADHGARVINLSYAGYSSPSISEAAKYARSKNAVFVMAAGNDAGYVGGPDDPNIIAVSATTEMDTLASFTSTGPYVDLAAPGSGILTTGLDGTYQSVSGTSFSAPLVAGTAALMLSAYPTLSAAQVEAILKVSTDDRGASGYDTGYGFGRLNAGYALELTREKMINASDVTAPRLRFLEPRPQAVVGQTAGEPVRLEAIDDRQVAKVTLYADGQMIGQLTSSPFTFAWNTSRLANGSAHTLGAVARDKAGNTTSLELPVTVQAGYDVTPPLVEITSPADGSQIKFGGGGSDSVRVSVSASDNSGKILGVELYVDGVLIAQSVSSPYRLLWPGDQIAPGRHTLVCLAYDSAFNIGRSNMVTVTR